MKNTFLAGAGSAPICFPSALFPYEGFCGVHDDPAARVLLLECGQRTAIVCLELVMLSADGNDAVKKAVAKATNTEYDHIWVHTTHAITTPHAPHAPMGMGGVELEISLEEKEDLNRKIGLYHTALMDAVEEAACKANETLRPAKMGVGTGPCNVNVNRDVETAHGWWIGFAPDGPSNHTATALRFEDEEGVPIAHFISYGLKPCAIDNSEMENNTRLVSSDVPGLACTILEKKFGAPCLFAMSAAGDQVPLEQAWYDVVEADGTIRKVDLGVQEGLKIVDRLGRRMAEELAPILLSIHCMNDEPTIELGESRIQWPGKARVRQKLIRSAAYTEEGMLRVDVLAMTLGPVAFVGLKPEINAVTEKELLQLSPYSHTLILSMVNGGQKYMPDRRSYDHCTWEAQSAPMMPGAAEAWVAEAAELLKRIAKGEK